MHRFVSCPVLTAALLAVAGAPATAAASAYLHTATLETDAGAPILVLGLSAAVSARVERTRFEREKITAQVLARVVCPSFLTDGAVIEEDVRGYEIHMGVVELGPAQASPFEIRSRNGRMEVRSDGAISGDGMVVGTMLHGLFENEVIRSRTFAFLRRRKGLPERSVAGGIPSKQAEYDRLEATVREHIDCELLWRLTGLGPSSRKNPCSVQGLSVSSLSQG